MVHNGEGHSGMVIRAFLQDNTGNQMPQRKQTGTRDIEADLKAGAIPGIQMGQVS